MAKSKNIEIYELADKTLAAGRDSFSARIPAVDWRTVYVALWQKGWHADRLNKSERAPKYITFTAYRRAK